MSKFDYYRCDECRKVLENTECSPNQLMFTLIANYDTSEDLSFNIGGKQAHFCSKKCLRKFIDKIKEHCDLPTIEYNIKIEEVGKLADEKQEWIKMLEIKKTEETREVN